MLKEVVQVIGMGQCGNRIGQEFEKIGLDVSYINSDEVDLRGLGAQAAQTLMIATTGTGADPSKGRGIFEKNEERFEEFFRARMDRNKLQLFVVGLGGGTGGGFVCPAVKMAKEAGYKVVVLATLPSKLMGALAARNALSVLKNLRTLELNGLILVDNEYMSQKVGLSANWWQNVNQSVVANLSAVFDLLRPGKITHGGLGSIDKGEIMRIMQTGKGETDVRSFLIDLKSFEKDDAELAKILFAPGMVEGYDYKGTLSYLVGVDVPMKGSYTEEASRIFNITKQKCGSALSRPGMFQDPLLYGSIRVTMVNAGLKLPKVIQSRLNNLVRDEARYNDKLQKEEKVDLSTLSDDFMAGSDFDF